MKHDFPEEGEIVICTVTKVLPHAVFARLEEYGSSGLIHISEISPGRIRNIREYVKEGKVIVCKVLGVDKAKGHIDLSLRRVTEVQKRQKVSQVKQEKKSEKIIEYVAKKLGKKYENFYSRISSLIFKAYPNLYSCFEDVVAEKTTLKKLGVPEKEAKELEEVIRQRITLPDVTIKGIASITSFAPDGIQVVKKALKKIKMNVRYLGAGKYLLSITAPDYKTAEKKLSSELQKVENFMKKNNGIFEFRRKEE